MTSARNYNSVQKLKLINTIRRSNTITLTSRELSISRSTYYLWLRQLNDTRSLKYKKHYSGISSYINRKIYKIALNKPEYSIRKIASAAGVSTGYAWKALVKKNLTTRINRLGYSNIYGSRLYPEAGESTKLDVLNKYKNGLSVSHIRQIKGISRTTIYKWIKTYKTAHNSLDFLKSNRPKSSLHWNYKKGIENILLDIINENPHYALDELTARVNKFSTYSISRTGLYYILRRMKLNRLSDRIKYQAQQQEISNQKSQAPIINMIDKTTKSNESYLNYSPIISSRLLVYFSSVSVISLLILLLPIYIPAASMPKELNLYSSSGLINKDRVVSPEIIDSLSSWKKLKPIYSSFQNDFRKGVFISNTNKSIFKPGETAKFSLGVLNSLGTTICDADLNINIQTPDNKITSLSTTDGSVSKSPDCKGNSYSDSPDYSTAIKVGKAGLYKIIARSETDSGVNTLEDAFYVVPEAPFELDRTDFPTRVYPVSDYKVNIKIKSNQDFKGEVSEELPSGLTLSSSAGSLKAINNGNQLITWQVDWRKGREYSLSYTIKFPTRSPHIFVFEPLTITRDQNVIFEEARSWKISVDSVN